MRTSILLCAHVATAIQTIEVEKSVDQVIDELEIRGKNNKKTHMRMIPKRHLAFDENMKFTPT